MSASFVVPAADPRSNYLAHKEEIDQAIQRTLEKGSYILGDEVSEFEKEFAGYLGVKSAVGVANGTDALYLALRACGIGQGDAVITVSHTAVATVAAIEMAGATPVLVDIDPATFTMDPDRVEQAMKQIGAGGHRWGRLKVKALVPVHLYGHPAAMDSLMEIARRHHLLVVEDCAQAHGAEIRGRKAGTWGDISAFSFYPTKNLGALGDGGMVATNDSRLAEQVRLLREYGWRERYVSEISGQNSRLDEIQAAILRVKLRYLDSENDNRRRIAASYRNLLARTQVNLPAVRSDATSVYHQFVVRTPKRDALRRYLQEHGIGTLIHYPVPIHLQPAYLGRYVGEPCLPKTETAVREILSLPIYPELDDLQVHAVAQRIKAWSEA